MCHALQDTGVLGMPAEYFHRGDEQFWRAQWKTATEDGFLSALRERPVTANGVWGSKMMWNYFDGALARLRAWPRLAVGPGASDPEVLVAAFPRAAVCVAAARRQAAAGDLLVARRCYRAVRGGRRREADAAAAL